MEPMKVPDSDGVEEDSREATGAKAETSNVPVFRAYFELAEARTPAEKVRVLERLYQEGWDDATRSVDEGLDEGSGREDELPRVPEDMETDDNTTRREGSNERR